VVETDHYIFSACDKCASDMFKRGTLGGQMPFGISDGWTYASVRAVDESMLERWLVRAKLDNPFSNGEAEKGLG